MVRAQVERWDADRLRWVSLRGGLSVRRFVAAVGLGGLAAGVFVALLLLAPLERGLFFADARYPFEVLIAMLAVVTAVDRALSGLGLQWRRPMDWAVGAYAVGYATALLLRPAAVGAALDGAFLGVALLLWYWCAGHLWRGAARVRLLAHAVLATGVLLALLGGLAAMGVFHFPYAVLGNNRILSTLQYPNALAACLITSLCAAFGLMQQALRADASRQRQWSVAAYGAGAAVMTVVLVGTYSRGGWLVFLLASAVWLCGVPRAHRLETSVTAGWAVLSGLLLSRAFLEPFRQAGNNLWGGASAETVALLVAGGLGALGAPGFHYVVRFLRRQSWSPAVRRALGVAAAVYGGIALLILGLVAQHNAARSGEGLLGSAFGHRVTSIAGGAGAAQPRYTFWADAWRLIRARPLQGYGAGGWTALYHQVQRAPYAANLIHGSLFQAWVDGGLLAVAGLAAMGVLILLRGWHRRNAEGGGLLWGLAVGGFGLWVHALLDFDLSIPALAFLLWAIAGCLRNPVPVAVPGGPPAPQRGGLRRWGAAAGLVTVGTLCVALLVYAQRFGFAARLASYSAAAMENHQYATAYVTGGQAVRLDPLSASSQADQAQLLAAAYSVNHVPIERTDALAAASRAVALDQGDLTADEAVLNVADDLAAWPTLRSWSADLLVRYPLLDSAYDDAAAALLRAGEAQLGAGDVAGARADLSAVTGETDQYATAALRLEGSAASAQAAPLSNDTLLTVGEADLLLGQSAHADAILNPLAQQGDATAIGWLSAATNGAGRRALGPNLTAKAKTATVAPVEARAEQLLAQAAAAGL